MLISLNYYQTSSGPHGGIVKPAGAYNIELKSTYPNLYTFLLDKNNKPMRNKGILCEIDFLLSDKTKINSQLTPYMADGFMMELGTFNYSTCKVLYNVYGKTISADFDNESAIVKKQ